MTKTKPKAPPDTVITLTLPGSGGITRTATLVARRGDLAALKQFPYANLNDLALAIRAITVQLNTLELNPPQLPQPALSQTPQSDNHNQVLLTNDANEIDEAIEDAGEETEDPTPEDAQDGEWATQEIPDSYEEPVEIEADPLGQVEDLATELFDPAGAGYDRDVENKTLMLDDTPPTHLPPGSATQQLEMF